MAKKKAKAKKRESKKAKVAKGAKTSARKKKLRAIEFDYSGGEKRTETIRAVQEGPDGEILAEFEPFDITFTVPTPNALRAIVQEMGYAKTVAARVEAASEFSSKYLVKWTLAETCGLKAISAMKTNNAFWSIFNEIASVGDDLKN